MSRELGGNCNEEDHDFGDEDVLEEKDEGGMMILMVRMMMKQWFLLVFHFQPRGQEIECRTKHDGKSFLLNSWILFSRRSGVLHD